MMNKKRSRGIGRAKYLVFIPVAGCMMLFSNIDALARITNKITDEVSVENFLPQNNQKVKVSATVIDEFRKPVSGASVIIKGTPVGTVSDLNGKFELEGPDDAILQISFVDLETREVEMKNINENLKVQLLPKKMDASDQVFTMAEKMPVFPGGDNALLKYLSVNMKYPVIAQENGVQGRVTCMFTIGKDGSISNAVVLAGVDPSLDTEALRLINKMPKWEPATQRGVPVAIRFTVPVVFRLNGNDLSKNSDSSPKEYDNSGSVFTVVEDMPRFPGGSNQLVAYLKENVKYPVSAQQKGISGRVSCQFIVNQDGTISDVEVVKGVDVELDKEALRVISGMPNWEPGKQRGKAVKVRFTVPVTFSLSKKS